jgi:hypothetical protein
MDYSRILEDEEKKRLGSSANKVFQDILVLATGAAMGGAALAEENAGAKLTAASEETVTAGNEYKAAYDGLHPKQGFMEGDVMEEQMEEGNSMLSSMESSSSSSSSTSSSSSSSSTSTSTSTSPEESYQLSDRRGSINSMENTERPLYELSGKDRRYNSKNTGDHINLDATQAENFNPELDATPLSPQDNLYVLAGRYTGAVERYNSALTSYNRWHSVNAWVNHPMARQAWQWKMIGMLQN